MKLTVKCKTCGEPTDLNVLYAVSVENVIFNTSVICKKCSGLDKDKREEAREKARKYKKRLEDSEGKTIINGIEA